MFTRFWTCPEAWLQPSRHLRWRFLTKMVNGFRLWTISAEKLYLGCLIGSTYASDESDGCILYIRIYENNILSKSFTLHVCRGFNPTLGLLFKNHRSSLPEVLQYFKKVSSKIYSKFTGKHPCWSIISVNLLCKLHLSMSVLLWISWLYVFVMNPQPSKFSHFQVFRGKSWFSCFDFLAVW